MAVACTLLYRYKSYAVLTSEKIDPHPSSMLSAAKIAPQEPKFQSTANSISLTRIFVGVPWRMVSNDNGSQRLRMTLVALIFGNFTANADI